MRPSSASRVALSDRQALVFAGAPSFNGLKVIGGIHWEALRLWLKGVNAAPTGPARARHLVTIVQRSRDDDAQTFRPAA